MGAGIQSSVLLRILNLHEYSYCDHHLTTAMNGAPPSESAAPWMGVESFHAWPPLQTHGAIPYLPPQTSRGSPAHRTHQEMCTSVSGVQSTLDVLNSALAIPVPLNQQAAYPESDLSTDFHVTPPQYLPTLYRPPSPLVKLQPGEMLGPASGTAAASASEAAAASASGAAAASASGAAAASASGAAAASASGAAAASASGAAATSASGAAAASASGAARAKAQVPPKKRGGARQKENPSTNALAARRRRSNLRIALSENAELKKQVEDLKRINQRLQCELGIMEQAHKAAVPTKLTLISTTTLNMQGQLQTLTEMVKELKDQGGAVIEPFRTDLNLFESL